MASLFNNRIDQTYQGLIKTVDNGPISATPSRLSDGVGNTMSIQISKDSVIFDGIVDLTGASVSGISGVVGSSGTSGVSGSSGSSGTSGSSGSSGSSGTSGVSGSSGSSGTSGVSGSSGSSGTSGSSGSSGSSGTSGTSGVNGLSNSFFNYRSKNNIFTGDPGSTHIIWNTATQSAATTISVSDTDALSENVDIFLSNIVLGTIVILQDKSNHTNYQSWTINTKTDNGTYWTYGVSLVTSTYQFSNNNDMLFIISTVPSGTSGSSGSSGSSGTSGVSGSSGSSGTSGVSGSSGSSGTSGSSGSSGSSGTSGVSGSSGSSGSSGTSGVSGSSGSSGTSGISPVFLSGTASPSGGNDGDIYLQYT
jgi:hypothetical protein